MECPVKGFKGVRQGSPVAMSPRILTKSPDPTLPRKAAKESRVVTVPQTDTGSRGENPQAFERTLLKELGKLTP